MFQMPPPPLPLPASWVDRIFAKLALAYGAEVARKWEGLNMDDVKSDWAQELGGLSGESIAHALQHLPPDRPLTAMAFRALSLGAPLPKVAKLPAPVADPAVMRKALGSIERAPGFDPKSWAHRLKAREERGDRLTQFQRQEWREALADRQPAEAGA